MTEPRHYGARHYPRFDTSICPSPVGCARTLHHELFAGDTCECCGTTIYAEPELIADACYRVSTRDRTCTCPGGSQPCLHPDCMKEISPGGQYVEYLGEAAVRQSGKTYCIPCGVATWALSKWVWADNSGKPRLTH